MKVKMVFMALAVSCLTACAQLDPHPMDMGTAIRNARTASDHKALARHYEDAAKEMRVKVEEHKKELREYETHPYYGKRAQDLKAHCERLINSYQQAAEANSAMADSHRRMAAETR